MAEIVGIEVVDKPNITFRIRFKGKKKGIIDIYYRFSEDAYFLGCEKYCILKDICSSNKQIGLVSGDLEIFCCVRLQNMKEIADILVELERPGYGLGGFYISEIKRR